MTDNGLITIPSAHSVKDTIDRIESEVKSKGMTVFARIDHAAGAIEVGLKLAPTELLIFGSAKAGTPLMQFHQQVGIDLPLKMLGWEDPSGKRWLSYNDPVWLARRQWAWSRARSSRRRRGRSAKCGCEKGIGLICLAARAVPVALEAKKKS
jgi:uncharacterized protein (DUF302 family)